LERLDSIIIRQLVFNVIEKILLYGLSDVCFDLSQPIFQVFVFLDILVMVAEILIVLYEKLLSRLSW
jgi:hypothetical protein